MEGLACRGEVALRDADVGFREAIAGRQ